MDACDTRIIYATLAHSQFTTGDVGSGKAQIDQLHRPSMFKNVERAENLCEQQLLGVPVNARDVPWFNAIILRFGLSS